MAFSWCSKAVSAKALLPTFFIDLHGVFPMKKLANRDRSGDEEIFLVPPSPTPLALPSVLDPQTARLVQRMFRDPRVLDEHERGDLIAQLRNAVELAPQAAEVRVLLGMALSVDLQAQEAMEQLREAANQAPDCFIAHLKFGELLMRLRICRQAEEETQKAAQLATNDVQAEMARRQAATIRTMLREGIERGGYRSLLPNVLRFRRKTVPQDGALVGSK
jgi:tetratricopeptide (TPR) repeat protein